MKTHPATNYSIIILKINKLDVRCFHVKKHGEKATFIQDFFNKKRLAAAEVQESESDIDINNGSFSLDSELRGL